MALTLNITVWVQLNSSESTIRAENQFLPEKSGLSLWPAVGNFRSVKHVKRNLPESVYVGILSPASPEEKCAMFRTSCCVDDTSVMSSGWSTIFSPCPKHSLLHTLLFALRLVGLVILDQCQQWFCLPSSPWWTPWLGKQDSDLVTFSEGGSATCTWALNCLGTWLWGCL